MSMENYPGTVDPNAQASLYSLIKSRLEKGEEEQDALIDAVHQQAIRDRLVPPRAMTFCASEYICIKYADEEELYKIHYHALGQLCAEVKLPQSFATRLSGGEAWEKDLLVENLNTLFTKTKFPEKKNAARFLHRLVGRELRGFLSQRFNVHLASAPLLQSFLVTAAEMGAFLFSAYITDVRFAAVVMLPFVFEPIPNHFVCVGMGWSNSDFGKGKAQVSLSLWLPNSGGFVVMDNPVSRVHIGCILTDSDLDVSQETAQKEVEAQRSVIEDAVRSRLNPKSVQKLLDAVGAAHVEGIPWSKLKHNLARLLSKSELQSVEELLFKNSGIIDLPTPKKLADGDLQPTKWWATHAITWLSEKSTDKERKIDLQQIAGSFIKQVEEE